MGEKMTLLPCPFCGSVAIIIGAPWAEEDAPTCDDCMATAPTVEAWNTRHLTQPAQAVDVEKDRFALNDRVQFNNGKHVFGGYVYRIEYPYTIYYVQLDDGCEYACYGDDPKVTLTAALPNANGKEDTPDAAR